MIATDHQYAVTADRLARFERSLEAVGEGGGNPFARAQASSLREQVTALKQQMSEYDDLRSGGVREIVAETLADLPVALIKARIARGLSQSALAELLGSKQQLVQRWEAERFRGATFETLTRVARILRVHVSERIDLSAAGPVSDWGRQAGAREDGLSDGRLPQQAHALQNTSRTGGHRPGRVGRAP